MIGLLMLIGFADGELQSVLLFPQINLALSCIV